MEEILHHLGCIKSCKKWDIYHINWCRISSINSMNRHRTKKIWNCCSTVNSEGLLRAPRAQQIEVMTSNEPNPSNMIELGGSTITHGNPQPSFLGVISPIFWGLKTFIFCLNCCGYRKCYINLQGVFFICRMIYAPFIAACSRDNLFAAESHRKLRVNVSCVMLAYIHQILQILWTMHN